jgi:uncharacterized protein
MAIPIPVGIGIPHAGRPAIGDGPVADFPTDPDAIRASTILPARRQPLTLTTSDGLHLEADLALPADRPPVATAVCLHPLPTHGGSMDSHVLRKMAWRLPALADIAVLRINTRGTGGSEGTFGGGVPEVADALAALAAAADLGLPDVWLVGWSFGADLAVRVGPRPGVHGAILLSPPLRYVTDDELDAYATSGTPLVALVPEHDDYLPPPAAEIRFARIPQCRMVPVEGAVHLWIGESQVSRVLTEIANTLVPGLGPLPTVWRNDERST